MHIPLKAVRKKNSCTHRAGGRRRAIRPALAAFFFLFILYLPANAQEEAYAYSNQGKRDPFVPLLGVTTKSLGSLEDVMSIDDVVLQGIATNSSGNYVAVLNNSMVKQGQVVGKVTVKNISPNKVAVILDGTEYTLSIYEDLPKE
ncbi:MAG: hypothetical protein JW994_04435 [Candidatus Omnitrophica bacterium]|nr:hypothetical protein [Candidatus Omnitrophota bacterium]